MTEYKELFRVSHEGKTFVIEKADVRNVQIVGLWDETFTTGFANGELKVDHRHHLGYYSSLSKALRMLVVKYDTLLTDDFVESVQDHTDSVEAFTNRVVSELRNLDVTKLEI